MYGIDIYYCYCYYYCSLLLSAPALLHFFSLCFGAEYGTQALVYSRQGYYYITYLQSTTLLFCLVLKTSFSGPLDLHKVLSHDPRVCLKKIKAHQILFI